MQDVTESLGDDAPDARRDNVDLISTTNGFFLIFFINIQ
jgi:hypothetical protein